MEVYPEKDGCVRVVWLKTAVGEIVHPVQVYPLEVDPELNKQQAPDDMKFTPTVLKSL